MIQFAIVCLVLIIFALNHLIIWMWKGIVKENNPNELIILGFFASVLYILVNIWIVYFIILWGKSLV